ncbi:PREDICTED: uncharacterized protein LOC104808906 [Tarenaya hassleriana]|uniref:uncharacterized protein LOC104808906 n=1 Tax=Tarenaya hassleriana TaxID=28532 RepID=UPI00053C5A2D|nr:PREDICTED: uncharacterized protein LOC104808906 [Tarenaya hassleriana]
MAGDECLRMKMKRRDIDRVNDDFSDFSLSSPARKMRRLDVDFPPIMKKDEAEMATAKPMAEESKLEPVNEERAIVVFKPLQAQQSYCRNLYVDTGLISGFKNKLSRAGYHGDAGLADDDYDENQTSNKCRAVVPWSPSQFPAAQSEVPFQEPYILEIIQLDEDEDTMMEEATMEIEEDSNCSMSLPQETEFIHGFRTIKGIEGLHHWQQQPHCLIPQPPQSNSTPISWSL